MSGIQGLGGPLYEDTRIVEGGQGDERDAPMEGKGKGLKRKLKPVPGMEMDRELEGCQSEIKSEIRQVKHECIVNR